MTSTPVTFAQRKKMNELIDSLSYPSKRKAQLVSAAKTEGFAEFNSDYSETLACFDLYTKLASYGADSAEFEASYAKWVRANDSKGTK